MGTLFLPAAQNDQEMLADLQSRLSPSVGRTYSQVYNFEVLEGFTGAMVKQHALNDIANTGEKLSVDQLRKEYADGLVKFDRPLTRAQAELIRDRKREEIQRQDIWQRAEGWATASGVTASLAAGVVDPVGTTVGIVMAPAKWIQMLGGLRAMAAMAASSSLAYRALGTAGLTAVDAAIGNAVLEPYNLYSHQQYYADYTMADSLANVVFGGVLGGAVGGGAVVLGRGLSHVGKWTPEWLRGKQEATHETSLHTAVAQVLDGRPVQVEPILRSDPNLRMAEGHPVQAAEMAGPRVEEPTISPRGQDPNAPAMDITLPKDLAGAKPRYSYGAGRNGYELFELEFASDLDKAAYIIGATKQLSKRDADYLEFVMQHTGYTAEQARAYGREIRAQIKALAKESFGKELGTLQVEPSMHALLAREAKLKSGDAPVLTDIVQPLVPAKRPPPGRKYQRLSASELQSVVDQYTGGDSMAINSALAVDGRPSTHTAELVAKLDEYLARGRAAKDTQVVYRAAWDEAADAILGLKVGDIYHNKAYMSTTTTKEALKRILRDMEDFGPESQVILEITLPAGKRWGRGVRDSSGYFDYQSEFLLDRSLEFKVTGIKSDGTVQLEALRRIRPDRMEFTTASGQEVLAQAKQHMEAPRTGAADDVAENFDAEILATHKDTAEYYEPAAKTRKMMELEKEIDYQQSRLMQEHGDVQVDGLKQADDALNKADDLRAAMVEGMACLLRK